MNKSDLIATMTQRLSGDRGTAAAAVNGVLAEIEAGVARGERVSLTGFGTFDRRERASRTARNPRTGEVIVVGPSVVAVFRAGTGFKTLLAEAAGGAGSGASGAVERSVQKAKKKKKSVAVALRSSAESAVVAADAAADGRKRSGKKAPAPPAEKGSKSARKAAKGKAGKKAAKGIR